MKRLNKMLAPVLAFVMCISLGACNLNKETDNKEYRLKIVTTLFPYYDFARAIIGDVEGIELSLTVSPGQDSHSFEPSPKDIVNMEEADLLIYNGGSIENWVDTVLDSTEKDTQAIMRMMDYVEVMEEETVEGMDLRFEESHNHSHSGNCNEEQCEDEYSEEEHAHDEHSEEEHSGEYDEHIWTSPANAMLMVQYICERICELDVENEDIYRANAKKYINELAEIDGEIRDIVKAMENKEIVFADKFPMLYFVKEYGLTYYAAFPGCGSDMEPSAKTIAFLIDKVSEDRIDKVFYLELSSPSVANVICEDTGAKAYQLNTGHNVTQKQFDDGVTYADLMRENVANLKK